MSVSAETINELLTDAAQCDDDEEFAEEHSVDSDYDDSAMASSMHSAISSQQDPAQQLQALSAKIAELEPSSELSELIQALTPISYRGGTFLLAYDRHRMTQHHVRILQDSSSLRTLNHAFQLLFGRGRVEITAQLPTEDEDGRAGLRPCTLEEREALADRALFREFKQIFGSSIIDARVRESS